MPGLKPTIYEACRECGQKDAQIRNGQVFWGMHKCPKAPPGPRQPPHNSRLRDVVFVPAEWPRVRAQHEETGRIWEGPRDQIPPRYSEIS
jgi:hypothetical protein